MKSWLVQATMQDAQGNKFTYTHYACATEVEANAKAKLLQTQHPELQPIEVIGFTRIR